MLKQTNTTTTIDAGNRRYTITEWFDFNKPLVTVNYRVIRNAKPYGGGPPSGKWLQRNCGDVHSQRVRHT